MRRRVVGCALLALAATVLAVPAGAAACGRTAAIRSGTWFEAKPKLPAHSAAHQAVYGSATYLNAAAIDPTNPGIVYASTGKHLLRSGDGGCSWHQVYALPEAPGVQTPDGDLGEIRSIDVTRVAGRPRVLLAVQGTGWGAPASVRTAIVRSDDGVGGWTAVTDLVSFTGTYDLRMGPWKPVVHSAGGVTYAAVPSATGTVAYVRSVDGGKSWSLRTLPDPKAPTSMRGFAINPYDPDELWEWGAGFTLERETVSGLRRSTDGGASWMWIDPWPMYGADEKQDVSVATITWARRGAAARVLVLAEAGLADDTVPIGSWSGDGGRSFVFVAPPRVAAGFDQAVMTSLANGDAVVIDGNRTTFRVRNTGRVPRAADWRPLRKVPSVGMRHVFGFDLMVASTTAQPVVVVPALQAVQTLTVAR